MPRAKKSDVPEAAETTPLKPASRRLPRSLPLLPIRDNVYFPHMLFPLFVGREKSVKALDEAMAHQRYILLIAQHDMTVEDPEPDDIYRVGVVAEVIQILKVPDGTVRVMLEGIERVQVTQFIQQEPFFKVRVKPLPAEEAKSIELEALMRNVTAQFEQIVNNGRTVPPEVLINVINIDEPGKLADSITPYLPLRVEQKQEILETIPVRERLSHLSMLLKKELEILEIQRSIRSRVEKEMGDSQREFFLREQLKAIQQELGERDERTTEIEDYRGQIAEAQMPEEVESRALKEVERLEKMPYASPEGVVIRTYLDWLVGLPWNFSTSDELEITKAEKILNEDHYGLLKPKERILEFLAVRKLAGSLKGPILCFAGPPGVGKTSIGKSIARSLGRKFVRISLGGVRDEAEIRGHRRTYVGALPGRIIQGIKQAGSRNPVFMLDEIDKVGADFRGDPSAALLEALDPEQNDSFSDHYLEVPFNLRDVMFITTANVLDTIPAALRDRMEIIPFSGYIEDDKLQIARSFLVPKQLKEHGITKTRLSIGDDALLALIREYTREAGVRNLEREIASLCRKVAKKIAEGETGRTRVKAANIAGYLGKRRFHYGQAEEQDEVGAATGLSYSEFGGDIISIEVGLVRATKGGLILTGQLGDVMKESAQAALTYVRSRASVLNFDEDFQSHTDIHIHVPAGGIPKDGPSAGITIATALASALTKRPVRKDVAMTGEITLRGRVLPIGGLREKVLAAHRAGIRTVILPRENEKDIEDIPSHLVEEMQLHLVDHMDDVLSVALLEQPILQTQAA
ncbi:MAG: endopeptidase La [Armatimonadetes bacterium]|nr:endopeptidase La [Armatimonadota bacterium]